MSIEFEVGLFIMDGKSFEALTVSEVGEWLSQKGFSVEVQDAFEGEHCMFVLMCAQRLSYACVR